MGTHRGPLEDYALVQYVTLILSRVDKTGIFSGVLMLIFMNYRRVQVSPFEWIKNKSENETNHGYKLAVLKHSNRDTKGISPFPFLH